MSRAVYAISGDPITYGHTDIIVRALKAFGEVVVGIGDNPAKKYLFAKETRLEMAQKALAMFRGVTVKPFQGLLADFAYENQASVVIRGIRNTNDFNYEFDQYVVNTLQRSGLDTFFIPATPALAHVSSSLVKGLQQEHGDIYKYVHPVVKQRLEEVISGQYLVGITGEIAAGKSYVANWMVKKCLEVGIQAHNIEFDHLGHELLNNKDDLGCQVCKRIQDELGVKIINEPGGYASYIDRKQLGSLVFSDRAALQTLNKIMYEPLLIKFRQSLRGKQGLIFLNSALLVESNLFHLCNRNIIFVRVDAELQKRRLQDRIPELSDEQVARRLATQYTYANKIKSAFRGITTDGGVVNNLWEMVSTEDCAYDVLDSIIKKFHLLPGGRLS